MVGIQTRTILITENISDKTPNALNRSETILGSKYNSFHDKEGYETIFGRKNNYIYDGDKHAKIKNFQSKLNENRKREFSAEELVELKRELDELPEICEELNKMFLQENKYQKKSTCL